MEIIAAIVAKLGPLFAAALARVGFKSTAQQVAIFAHFFAGNGNLLVRARAGTGKTTTIMSALGFARERTILVAAFSKDIADELAARVKNIRTAGKVEARSLHSLGNGLCWYHLAGAKKDGAKVDETRGRRLAKRSIIERDLPAHREMITLVSKLASLGKNMTPFATKREQLVMNNAKKEDGSDLTIAEAFNLTEIDWDFNAAECPSCGGTVPHIDETRTDLVCGTCGIAFDHVAPWTIEVIEALAVRAMELATVKEMNDAGQVVYDYDDQIFLPVRMRFARPKYDLVVIDEAQDMNYTQLLLAQRVAKGRVVVVGDDKQAIYAFRGADSGALDRLKKELRATELGLTITFRCPRRVVEMAQELVPDYMAADDAPEGEIIEDMSLEALYKTVEPGDFVLSRTNAPITKICLRLLRMGKRAFIRGRNIGDELAAVVQKINPSSIVELVDGLKTWQKDRLDFLTAQAGKDGEIDDKAAEKITDTAETILALAQDLATVPELFARINALFSNVKGDANTITCSSIHRAKGLEANRVFALVDTLRFGSDEERNIAYVCYTRAKKTFAKVHGK